MSFIWTSKKPKEGIATFYESNITLNKSASSHFDYAFSVLLGLDTKEMKIALKPISKEEHELGAIPEEKRHKITVKPSYARVCNKKFMNEISKLIGIDLTNNKSFKFKTNWSKEDSALVIDLSQEEE